MAFSPVIENCKVKSYNVKFRKTNIFETINTVLSIVLKEKCNVLHAFDMYSYFWARVVANRMHLPLILTKCGGPNPRKYWPCSSNLITYSQENYDYFRKRKRNKGLWLIPNRVTKPKKDLNRICKLRSEIQNDHKVFLRITRFNHFYESTIRQSLHLVQKMAAEGYKVQLLLVGRKENTSIYESIMKDVDNNVIVKCDREFTINASELIDIADYVIGGGRSFMEAASYKKPLLVPLRQANYPLLISANNFEVAFDNNFSQRISSNHYDEDKNYAAIIKSLEDMRYYNKLAIQSKSWFDKYFDINAVVEQYIGIYKELRYEKDKQYFDQILNILSLMNK